MTLTSLGNNVFTDGTCYPVGSDQVVSDAELDALADLIAPYEAALLAEDEATHKQQPDER